MRSDEETKEWRVSLSEETPSDNSSMGWLYSERKLIFLIDDFEGFSRPAMSFNCSEARLLASANAVLEGLATQSMYKVSWCIFLFT
jgi:hypothetical protein